MHSFQLVGLDEALFVDLFRLSDEDLAQRGIVRTVATESPGYPCRVSLEDAAVGDELLLLPFAHHEVASPYRATGPIFVRRGARRRRWAAGDLPAYVTQRLISLRAYDSAHMMICAAVVEGRSIGKDIERHFADAAVAYIHLHNAKQGCFSCLVERA